MNLNADEVKEYAKQARTTSVFLLTICFIFVAVTYTSQDIDVLKIEGERLRLERMLDGWNEYALYEQALDLLEFNSNVLDKMESSYIKSFSKLKIEGHDTNVLGFGVEQEFADKCVLVWPARSSFQTFKTITNSELKEHLYLLTHPWGEYLRSETESVNVIANFSSTDLKRLKFIANRRLLMFSSGNIRKPNSYLDLDFFVKNVPNYKASVFVPKSWGNQYFYFKSHSPSYQKYKKEGYVIEPIPFKFKENIDNCDGKSPIDGLASIIDKRFLVNLFTSNLNNALLSDEQVPPKELKSLLSEIEAIGERLKQQFEELKENYIFAIRYAEGSIFIPVDVQEISMQPRDVLRKMTSGQLSKANLEEEFPHLTSFVQKYGSGLRLDDMGVVFRKEARLNSSKVRFLTTDIPFSYMTLIGSLAVVSIYSYFYLNLANFRQLYQQLNTRIYHPWLILSDKLHVASGPAFALVAIPPLTILLNLGGWGDYAEKLVIYVSAGLCLVLSGLVSLEIFRVFSFNHKLKNKIPLAESKLRIRLKPPKDK